MFAMEKSNFCSGPGLKIRQWGVHLHCFKLLDCYNKAIERFHIRC